MRLYPGYALAWFFANDRVKLLAFRVFDVAQPRLLTGRRLGPEQRA